MCVLPTLIENIPSPIVFHLRSVCCYGSILMERRVMAYCLGWACCMESGVCPSVCPCRFLLGGVDQFNWEYLTSLTGAFKTYLSCSPSTQYHAICLG